MQLSDFDFHLPEELIAQRPLGERDASRLLVLNRRTGSIAHRSFRDFPLLLQPGDLLVLNDARVIPARLLGKKEGTGGRAELLLVQPASPTTSTERALGEAPSFTTWICLGQASKGFKPGARVSFEPVALSAEIVESRGGGEYVVRFASESSHPLGELLAQAGRLPLPPYITRAPEREDEQRYQTVFAKHSGSVAAPTAGLHFTDETFAELQKKGVEVTRLTLDVGPGTFLPVRDGELDKHKMHEERFRVAPEVARAVNVAKAEGRRVVAVGTTVVRTLESATDPSTGKLAPGEGSTALFIKPGYVFRQVDALLTNFHLPKSTLLMLVSAFAGREHALEAYRQAVSERYRFFSYGDAMWVTG
ncbi:MAG: tRNA preQ1(34) S-adenosylmethionine ribosyltransferase-isomerase QueA [Myxococcaceae bacterium]